MMFRQPWWVHQIELVWNLEREAVKYDPTIVRLAPLAMFRNRVLRERVAESIVDATGTLGYSAVARTHDGVIQLAAIFEENPFAATDPILSEAEMRRGWRPAREPRVFALNGPTESPHRQPEPELGNNSPEDGGCRELCLYYNRDPVDLRWRAELGLVSLFDVARQHLGAEHSWRAGLGWPLPEAPHGLSQPMKPRPYRVLNRADVLVPTS